MRLAIHLRAALSDFATHTAAAHGRHWFIASYFRGDNYAPWLISDAVPRFEDIVRCRKNAAVVFEIQADYFLYFQDILPPAITLTFNADFSFSSQAFPLSLRNGLLRLAAIVRCAIFLAGVLSMSLFLEAFHVLEYFASGHARRDNTGSWHIRTSAGHVYYPLASLSCASNRPQRYTAAMAAWYRRCFRGFDVPIYMPPMKFFFILTLHFSTKQQAWCLMRYMQSADKDIDAFWHYCDERFVRKYISFLFHASIYEATYHNFCLSPPAAIHVSVVMPRWPFTKKPFPPFLAFDDARIDFVLSYIRHCQRKRYWLIHAIVDTRVKASLIYDIKMPP